MGSQKTNIDGELPKKGWGAGQFANLRGVGKKEEVVFLREVVDTPMPTMVATDIEHL